jgi:hypothetical protein
MATATATTTTKIETTKIEVAAYNLTLSPEEAQTLHDVIYCTVVSAGRGEYLVSILNALKSAGIRSENVKHDFKVRVLQSALDSKPVDFQPGDAIIRFNDRDTSSAGSGGRP